MRNSPLYLFILCVFTLTARTAAFTAVAMGTSDALFAALLRLIHVKGGKSYYNKNYSNYN